MSWFSKAAGKAGGALKKGVGVMANPLSAIPMITGSAGAQNKYSAPAIATDPGLGAALAADREHSVGIGGQQQGYADYLRGQAMGTSNAPNPALGMLNNATAHNIQTAQAQIASAKGVNRAQAARMGSDAALQANQTAANQASTMRANQQLGTQEMYGQQLAGMGAQGLQQQGINQQALAAQNQAQNGQAGIQAGVAGQNAQINAGLLGGALGGVGSALGLYDGGQIGYADGGSVGDFEALDQGLAGSDQWLNGPTSSGSAKPSMGGGGSSLKNLGKGSLDTLLGFEALGKYASGGPVPAGTPESRLGQRLIGMYDAGRVDSFESGGDVGGHAVVAGDSPRNDRVPAMLSPGEIVIPRSHADSPEAAADFVRALQARGYDEGGEVEGSKPSFVDALRHWWSDRSERSSNDVADAMHASLPDALSARRAVKKNASYYDQVDQLGKGE